MKLIVTLLALAGTSTLLRASPIMGGPCGTTGTAAEFVALGHAGCNLVRDGARIYDIRLVTVGTVPGSFPEWPTLLDVAAPLAEVSLVDSVERTEILVNHVPIGPTLWLSYDSGRPTLGSWSERDKDGQLVYGFAFNDLVTYPGKIVHRFNLSSGQMPALYALSAQSQLYSTFDLVIESVSAPEPSAFLPLLGISAAWLLKRRRPTPRPPSLIKLSRSI